MKIVSLVDIGKDRWDDFCGSNYDAWLRHTCTWMEYTMHMRPEGESLNCSFGIVDEGKLLSIAPLIKETIYADPLRAEFGFAGWNNPYPAFENSLGEVHKAKLIKKVFAEIDRLAHIHDVVYAAFEIAPYNDLSGNHYPHVNPMNAFGFSITDIATHIVKIDTDEHCLLKQMRKGHKSDITAAQKNGLTTRVYDSGSITSDIFAVYRQIHFNASGRQTRHERTWQLMLEWIQKGLAILAVLYSANDMPIAAALTLAYKNAAYYGSSCIEPEYAGERGGMHLLLWETMKFLKQKGIRCFETGWQFTPTLSQEVPSEKEVNISLFKRGFGGLNVPYYRGEKFYNFEFMKNTYLERLAKFNRTWLQ